MSIETRTTYELRLRTLLFFAPPPVADCTLTLSFVGSRYFGKGCIDYKVEERVAMFTASNRSFVAMWQCTDHVEFLTARH